MTAPNVIKAVVGEDSNGQNRASSPSSFTWTRSTTPSGFGPAQIL